MSSGRFKLVLFGSGHLDDLWGEIWTNCCRGSGDDTNMSLLTFFNLHPVILHLKSDTPVQEVTCDLTGKRFSSSHHLRPPCWWIFYILKQGPSHFNCLGEYCITVYTHLHYPQCSLATGWHHWRQFIGFRAASSGSTKTFIWRVSPVQQISLRPVNTPYRSIFTVMRYIGVITL